jgi:hypothetical protein
MNATGGISVFEVISNVKKKNKMGEKKLETDNNIK